MTRPAWLAANSRCTTDVDDIFDVDVDDVVDVVDDVVDVVDDVDDDVVDVVDDVVDDLVGSELKMIDLPGDSRPGSKKGASHEHVVHPNCWSIYLYCVQILCYRNTCGM